jgi:hypothetical protein
VRPLVFVRRRVLLNAPHSRPLVYAGDDVPISFFTLSQPLLTFTYTAFSVAWCIVFYVAFVFLGDVLGVSLECLNVLGQNALLMYLLNGLVAEFIASIFPLGTQTMCVCARD